MAWEWSHTLEAYQSIERQLGIKAGSATSGDQDAASWLHICWAEYVASDWRDHNCSTSLDLHKYELALLRAKRQSKVDGFTKLANDLWQWSSVLRTCTNGGWEAWACPFGCHTLRFTEPDSDA